MNRANLTIFSQIVHLIDQNIVKTEVTKHQANKHAKGFATWDQLMCMVFCHFSQSQSLRDIVHGIASTTGNIHHIGMRKLPRRSTLSYSNGKRDWKVFRDIYFALYDKLHKKLGMPRINLPIKSKVYLLDTTLVQLSLKVFDWALYRTEKGAMKLHTLLDYQGVMPAYLHITSGKEHDLVHAKDMLFKKGCVVVADRGYFDFELLNEWNQEQEIKFVVRGRKKMVYKVLQDNTKDSQGPILKDQIIRLTGTVGGEKYTTPLRRVVVWDQKNQKTIILLTNVVSSWTAETISQLYKARWEIELFFKDLKQHLKIKSFVGTSLNAVLIQIWTAMITLLLIKYLKYQARYKWHLSNLVSFIRFNLLVSINLHSWLNNPIFTKNEQVKSHSQMALFPDRGG